MLIELALAMAAGAGSMSLEDLVRYSDVVVYARVARVVGVAREPRAVSPQESSRVVSTTEMFDGRGKSEVAEIEVERVWKGVDVPSKLVFLAERTWLCDITTAVECEHALFFLVTDEGESSERDRLGANFTAAFGDQALYGVMHSGRGRMPQRTIEGRDYVTYWDSDVVMPDDLQVVAGPEPEYEFIRSIALDELGARVAKFAEEQRLPALQLTVESSSRDGLRWTLSIERDRLAKLVIHGLGGDRERLFMIDRGHWRAIVEPLKGWNTFDDGLHVGPASDTADIAKLQLTTADGVRTITLHSIDAVTRVAVLQDVRAWTVLKVVTALRDAIDDPRCVELPVVDADLRAGLRRRR